MLFASGGLRNPFSLFLVVQVILGAILLDARTSWRVGAIGASIAVILGVLDERGITMGEPIPHSLPPFAVPLSICVTMGIALYLCLLVMEDRREQSRMAHEYHERAERERAKLADVLRFAGAAVVLLDHKFLVLWQNDRAVNLLGPLDTTQPFQLAHGPNLPFEAVKPGTAVQVDWHGKDVKGNERFHQISVSKTQGTQVLSDQWVLFFTDVTDRRLAERNLHRTEKLAALGRLAAGVAHEINTPLGSVAILSTEALTDAEAAIKGDESAAASLREQLQDIKSETDRMSRLVRRLLDLSHPEGETYGQTEVKALIRDSVRLATLRSPGAMQRIQLDLESPPILIQTDGNRLKQVLINLIDNAIYATGPSDGAVRIRSCADGPSLVV
jgi:C4-dicarboxylate-specific signal transduction histidine kinase